MLHFGSQQDYTLSQKPDDSLTLTPVHKRTTAKLSAMLLRVHATEMVGAELGGSALVFSPHPDDESLGCGGTIIKKKGAGAQVKVVQMTDGSASTTLIAKEELRALRRRESLNASCILGVDQTYFLDYPDSKLNEHISSATEKITDILETEQPEEVFVPHSREPMRQAADHRVTTSIVLAALRAHRRPVVVWEYPVWFWLHWPWVGFRQRCQAIRKRHVLKNSVISRFGARAFWDLTHSVFVGDVLGQKCSALAQHRSQMQQLVNDPGWATLGQVSDGDFLACFERDREFFKCYRYGHQAGRDMEATIGS